MTPPAAGRAVAIEELVNLRSGERQDPADRRAHHHDRARVGLRRPPPAVERAVSSTAWVLFGVMYALHMGGISIGFHRYLTHKSFTTSPAFEAILLVCGSMGGQGPIMDWITTHRRHHMYSDRAGDPHSPNLHGTLPRDRIRGLWHAHMPWMLSDETSKWSVFAPDVLSSRRVFFSTTGPTCCGCSRGSRSRPWSGWWSTEALPVRSTGCCSWAGADVPGEPGVLVRRFGRAHVRRPAVPDCATTAPTTGPSRC